MGRLSTARFVRCVDRCVDAQDGQGHAPWPNGRTLRGAFFSGFFRKFLCGLSHLGRLDFRLCFRFFFFFARKAVYRACRNTGSGVGFVGSLENLGKDEKKGPPKKVRDFYAPTKLKTPDVEGQPDREVPMMTTSKPRAVLRARSAFLTVSCDDPHIIEGERRGACGRRSISYMR